MEASFWKVLAFIKKPCYDKTEVNKQSKKACEYKDIHHWGWMFLFVLLFFFSSAAKDIINSVNVQLFDFVHICQMQISTRCAYVLMAH